MSYIHAFTQDQRWIAFPSKFRNLLLSSGVIHEAVEPLLVRYRRGRPASVAVYFVADRRTLIQLPGAFVLR